MICPRCKHEEAGEDWRGWPKDPGEVECGAFIDEDYDSVILCHCCEPIHSPK